MRTARLVAAALMVLALTACGFRLQGRAPLPEVLWNAQVIADDPQTDFVQGLRRALITSGGKLTKDENQATGTVRIHKDAVTRKILSVSAENTPREYEITYTVEFSVDGKAGEVAALAEGRDHSRFQLQRNEAAREGKRRSHPA